MFRAGILVTATLVLVLGSIARADDYTIGQKDKTFSMATLTVKAGDTVVFKNDDLITHNVYSTAKGNEFNLRAQAPGTNASVTLSAEGSVEVRCAFHPRMKLLVTVKK
jgi:plastocyanin